jgi:hypothetical protein
MNGNTLPYRKDALFDLESWIPVGYVSDVDRFLVEDQGRTKYHDGEKNAKEYENLRKI